MGELKDVIFKKELADQSVYPFSMPFFGRTERLRIHPKVTYLVGENGSGKSTLLEAIAVASGLNAEGGTANFSFDTRVSHSELYKHLTLSKGTNRVTDGFFLRSESFFNLATEIDIRDSDPDSIGGGRIIDYYGGKSLHEQSHGESFWALFQKRFGGNGLYLLDEPEAALSPSRQMGMLIRMHELISQRSQFIIATHSPILLAYPDALIYEFSDEGIRQKSYRETGLFQTYNEFFQNPSQMVNRLLDSWMGEDE
jgi:predicted ATPase